MTSMLGKERDPLAPPPPAPPSPAACELACWLWAGALASSGLPTPSGAPADPPTPQPQHTQQVLGECLTTFGFRNVGACLLPPKRASPGPGACRPQKGP